MFSMETVQNATLPGWKAVGVFSRRGLGRARATAWLRVSCVLPDSRGAVCRGVFSPEEGSDACAVWPLAQPHPLLKTPGSTPRRMLLLSFHADESGAESVEMPV